jgi:hypothetical protein
MIIHTNQITHIMKKLLLLLLCTTTLGLVSCKKDTIIEETPNRTINLNIQPNQWVRDTDGGTITAKLAIREIDEINVVDEGILVYIDHPVNEDSYIQLPYTFAGSVFSYEHFVGGINIDIQRSEFATLNPQMPTERIRVKVVLIPSRYIQ